jgi:hypothetical protein
MEDNLQGRDNIECMEVNGRIILKRIFRVWRRM